jgi:hypothetical protein
MCEEFVARFAVATPMFAIGPDARSARQIPSNALERKKSACLVCSTPPDSL